MHGWRHHRARRRREGSGVRRAGGRERRVHPGAEGSGAWWRGDTSRRCLRGWPRHKRVRRSTLPPCRLGRCPQATTAACPRRAAACPRSLATSGRSGRRGALSGLEQRLDRLECVHHVQIVRLPATAARCAAYRRRRSRRSRRRNAPGTSWVLDHCSIYISHSTRHVRARLPGRKHRLRLSRALGRLDAGGGCGGCGGCGGRGGSGGSGGRRCRVRCAAAVHVGPTLAASAHTHDEDTIEHVPRRVHPQYRARRAGPHDVYLLVLPGEVDDADSVLGLVFLGPSKCVCVCMDAR